MENLFAKWDLDFQATPAQIRQAYRRRAQKLHPDRRPAVEHTQAQEEFCVLQEEYALLQDDVRRQQHIQDLSKPFTPPSTSSSTAMVVPEPSAPTWFVPSGPINLTCRVPLQYIARGAKMWFIFPCARPCVCMRSYACQRCHGTGVVKYAKKILIDLPQGLPNHTVLSFPAQGHEGTHDIGTLYVHIKWIQMKGWKETQDPTSPLTRTIKLPPYAPDKVWVKTPAGGVGFVRWPEEKKHLSSISVYLPIGFHHQSLLVRCVQAPRWQAPWWWFQQSFWCLQNRFFKKQISP